MSWKRRDTQKWTKNQYGRKDSGKEVSRAEHEARNDAVGTDYQVRGPKAPTTSSSVSSSSSKK